MEVTPQEAHHVLDFSIDALGKREITNPFIAPYYYSDADRTIYNPSMEYIEFCIEHQKIPAAMEIAGPRRKIFFSPKKINVGIVTCGGLCPGINDVIRSIVMTSHYHYGVNKIVGFKYGYQGLTKEPIEEAIELTPKSVDYIHETGGSKLASSRGNQDPVEMLDTLLKHKIDILFTIGGDGTQRGALTVVEEVKKRNLNIAVVGIPKTIDNDIMFVSRTFGFETAFSEAAKSIVSGHNEAKGYFNCIALIKLMGRDSGFIAASAALAMPEVNFVLVPEEDFDLDGDNGFLSILEKRIVNRHHAVIVVAEGAGQKFFRANGNSGHDASGNVKYGDIGFFLKDKILEHFAMKSIPLTLKYIDPSYIIRSLPANANDSLFCNLLAQNAVHAGMCGKTGMIVGYWNNQFTHVPMKMAVQSRKRLSDFFWLSVIQATGQPFSMVNKVDYFGIDSL